MNPHEITLRFTVGYGGQCKASVTLDGEDYVLELDEVKERLANDMSKKGYTITQTKQQKYPRIHINN